MTTGGAPPDEAGNGGFRVPRFYGADALAGWQEVVVAVHSQDAGEPASRTLRRAAREHRARFAAEAVCACKEAAGRDFVVSYRLSQWKQLDYAARVAKDPRELAIIVAALTGAGVDLFHC